MTQKNYYLKYKICSQVFCSSLAKAIIYHQIVFYTNLYRNQLSFAGIYLDTWKGKSTTIP